MQEPNVTVLAAEGPRADGSVYPGDFQQPAGRETLRVDAFPAPSRVALSVSKRLLDWVGAFVGLLVLLPGLFFIALLIRLESPGPAVFRQERTGLAGRRFVVYKLRTMRAAPAGVDPSAPAQPGDVRITGLGALLRRSSIDELPQLLNVLKGDMSLVGPRPHAIEHDALYMATVEGYAARFAVRPGLTGLAQIMGSRGGGDVFEMRRRAVLDSRYIKTWSIWLDLKVIFLTIPHLIWFKAH